MPPKSKFSGMSSFPRTRIVTANLACGLACGSIAKGMTEIIYKGKNRVLPANLVSGGICDPGP